jgi:hypothetical protein
LNCLPTIVLGSRGSYSEATFNQHAVYFDEDSQIFGLPIKVYGNQNNPQESYYGDFIESGAKFYSINGDRFIQKMHESLQDIVPTECLNDHKNTHNYWWQNQSNLNHDVERIVNVDQEIVLVSPFGIRYLEKDLSKVNKTLVFSEADAYCDSVRKQANPYYCE